MSFQYDMTDERRTYYEARGKTILTACPGSGKTTSIVNKLSTIFSEVETEYGEYSGVACLSFTNKACDEIYKKYKELNGNTIRFPHLVSTIDSFIAQYIVLPFWQQSGTPLACRPTIIGGLHGDTDKLMRNIYMLSKGGKEIPNLKFKEYTKNGMFWKYPPEGITHGAHGQYLLNGKVLDNTAASYAKLCVDFRMEKGFISCNDAEYIACCILYHNPDIAKALAIRFPYIIIDEAQDTSYHQNTAINYLIANGLKNIELVGDLYQSIYRWRNACPEMLEKRMEDKDWNVLPMTECRRSVQRIIDVYSLIRKPTDDKIQSLGVTDQGHPIHIFKYNDDNISDVANRFVEYCTNHGFDKYAIVARGKTLIEKLVGKVKNKGFWKSAIPYTLIDAYLLFSNGEIKKAMSTICHLSADLKYGYNDYEEKKLYLNGAKDNYEEMSILFKVLTDMPSLDLSFDTWTLATQKFLKETLKLDKEPDFGKKKRGVNEMEDVSVSVYYSSVHSVKENLAEVQTIHAVKGESIPAVLVFLTAKSSGNSIAIDDFTSKETLTESQNLLYVACSRAEQYLGLAVPDSVSDEKIKRILSVTDEQIIKQ